ncbi:MAG TPA: alpha/beta hydrolase [Acidimicrobiales bacterium]
MSANGANGVTAVLVHGAGHTAAVWRETQAALRHPSLAVDLPGRGDRPADITTVTVTEAADAVVADVEAHVEGDVVLVGHSVAATLLPAAAARLGARVRHLVFVAGIAAPDGEPPVDVFLPGRREQVDARLAELRAEHGGQTLEAVGAKVGLAIDSLNLASQPMAWAGVPPALPRTFVRCLQDPIQPRELQDAFIAHCGAGTVVEIDSGHTPALDAPTELAALLDDILAASGRP